MSHLHTLRVCLQLQKPHERGRTNTCSTIRSSTPSTMILVSICTDMGTVNIVAGWDWRILNFSPYLQTLGGVCTAEFCFATQLCYLVIFLLYLSQLNFGFLYVFTVIRIMGYMVSYWQKSACVVLIGTRHVLMSAFATVQVAFGLCSTKARFWRIFCKIAKLQNCSSDNGEIRTLAP